MRGSGRAAGRCGARRLLHNPAVTARIIGPHTLGQLTGALRALEITLSGETLKRLDAIWPGPGGEAPVAYTW